MKKTCYIILFLFSVSIVTAQQRVKIGDNPTTINSTAALEVESTTKGFLPPRMTSSQRNAIATPSTGLQVYCTDCSPAGLYNYNGTQWAPIGSLTGGTLNSGNIIVGNASNQASSVAMSGEVTINNAGSSTVSNSAVTGKVLTGFTSGSGSISATDTVLGAIQKLDGNDALKAPIASPTFTGTPTLPSGATGFTQGAGNSTTALATTAFVASALSTAAVPNATTTATGKIQLAGDLAGTATAPTVTNSAVTGKVLTGFISTAGTVAATDNIVTAIGKLNGNDALKAPLASPTFTGVVTAPSFVSTVVTGTAPFTVTSTTPVANLSIGGNAATATTATNVTGTVAIANGGTGATTAAAALTNLGAAPIASPTFTGTPTLPTGTIGVTQTAGNSTTALATTAFVASALSTAAVPNATTTATGKIQLAGDLAGTATAPTVTNSAVTGKVLTGFISTAGTVAATDNIVTAIGKLNGNDALKAPIASPTFTGVVTAPSFTSTVATGTAPFAVTSTTPVANLSIGGNAATATTATNVTGTVAIANGGTGATTATGALTNLGAAPIASPTLTGTPTAPTALAGTNTTQLATTAFVTNAVTAGVTPDATTTATGKIQLAGDLAGTATAPTVTNSAVTGKVLTGYSSAAGTVAATDNIVTAIGKLNGNDALKAPIASPIFTTDIKVNTGITVGRGAGNQTSNTVVGSNALANNTTGAQNVAIGENTLNANTTGGNQIGIGKNALQANTTSFSNVAIGLSALGANTTGSNNTAIGTSTLINKATGDGNVALGSGAGSYIGTGSVTNNISNNSIFIGTNSRSSADNQTNQIVIGESALGLGSNSVVLGNDNIITTALKGNVGIGTTSPGATLDVNGNVKISGGTPGTGKVLTSDANGLATWTTPTPTATPDATTTATGKIQLAGDLSGTAALPTVTNAAVIGKVLTGYSSAAGTVAATDNIVTAIGKLNGNDALKAPIASPIFTTDIKVNTGITVGRGAGNQTSNTVVGSNALANNTTGAQNVAIGENTLNANTTGGNQIGIGKNALQANTTSFSNVAIGLSALGANTTGSNNTAIGTSTLINKATGDGNVALGSGAGSYIGTGSVTNNISNNSIFIGGNSRSSADNQTNQIVIGESALGLGSNSVVLGNNNIITTALKGNVGIGTTSPAASAKLDISSTNQGVLVPRMTAAQKNAISSPSGGLLVYQTDAPIGFYYYNGAWINIFNPGTTANFIQHSAEFVSLQNSISQTIRNSTTTLTTITGSNITIQVPSGYSNNRVELDFVDWGYLISDTDGFVLLNYSIDQSGAATNTYYQIRYTVDVKTNVAKTYSVPIKFICSDLAPGTYTFKLSNNIISGQGNSSVTACYAEKWNVQGSAKVFVK